MYNFVENQTILILLVLVQIPMQSSLKLKNNTKIKRNYGGTGESTSVKYRSGEGRS
jgi:hypothetical protein